jgi:hypothetical protein
VSQEASAEDLREYRHGRWLRGGLKAMPSEPERVEGIAESQQGVRRALDRLKKVAEDVPILSREADAIL